MGGMGKGVEVGVKVGKGVAVMVGDGEAVRVGAGMVAACCVLVGVGFEIVAGGESEEHATMDRTKTKPSRRASSLVGYKLWVIDASFTSHYHSDDLNLDDFHLTKMSERNLMG